MAHHPGPDPESEPLQLALALALLRGSQDRLSLINTVPSSMGSLLDSRAVPPSIGTVNLAGEPLRVALIEKIFDRSNIDRLCNLYGPSETTTYSTSTVHESPALSGVIKELETSGREPTATAVRERLGSGSYSTIAAVLTSVG